MEVMVEGMETEVMLVQQRKALSPMVVTPSSMTTARISSRLLTQGSWLAVVQSSILPVPEMVSTPSSDSLQIRLLPHPPAAKTDTGSMENSKHRANKKDNIRFFIKIPPEIIYFDCSRQYCRLQARFAKPPLKRKKPVPGKNHAFKGYAQLLPRID